MVVPDALLQLICDAEQYIQSKTPSDALPYLHRAFVYSTEFPEVRATACLRLAKVCRSVGQPFIGAEFLREANDIVSSAHTLRTLSSELEEVARLFADDPDNIVERSYRDLIFNVTHIWHRIGIPSLPVKESLLLAKVNRVDQPRPFFSNISWFYMFPFEQRGVAKCPLNPLLTAFDTNLGPHVMWRYEQTVAALRGGVDPTSELVEAGRLPTLAITLRIPKAELPALEQSRHYFCRKWSAH